MCLCGSHTLVIIVGEQVQTRYNVMFFDEADDDSAMKKPLPRLFLQFWSISSPEGGGDAACHQEFEEGPEASRSKPDVTSIDQHPQQQSL